MKSGKKIGKTIGKIAAICGAAGALEIFTNCFLFGGNFAKGESDEDTTEEAKTAEDETEETEKVSEEDVTIEEKTE